jgi:hypothetical protein
LFFVDRDHDDYVTGYQQSTGELFVTKFYAVENYAIITVTAERIIMEKMCVDVEKCNVAQVLENFRSQYKQFAKALLPLMAWTIVHRRRGNPVNLGNVLLSNIVDVKTNMVEKKRDGFAYYRQTLQVVEQAVPVGEVKMMLRELRNVNPKMVIRGASRTAFPCRAGSDWHAERTGSGSSDGSSGR